MEGFFVPPFLGAEGWSGAEQITWSRVRTGVPSEKMERTQVWAALGVGIFKQWTFLLHIPVGSSHSATLFEIDVTAKPNK